MPVAFVPCLEREDHGLFILYEGMSFMKKVVSIILAVVLVMLSFDAFTKTARAESSYDYTINVNRSKQIMTITRINTKGERVIVKTFICSTGAGGATTAGTYKTSKKFEWKKMIHDVWARYATLFSPQGQGLLIHSVPYYVKDLSRLESDQFNKLGKAVSAGCIRLSTADAKWVYDNCKSGTTVRVYDDPNEELPLPIVFKIPLDNPKKGWDPSANFDEGNPWIKTMYTTQECSIWKEPSTVDSNRIKYVPAGYPVQVIEIQIDSTRGDGKKFYKTIKGNYILAKCLSNKPIQY